MILDSTLKHTFYSNQGSGFDEVSVLVRTCVFHTYVVLLVPLPAIHTEYTVHNIIHVVGALKHTCNTHTRTHARMHAHAHTHIHTPRVTILYLCSTYSMYD